jgi:hypothetical protein
MDNEFGITDLPLGATKLCTCANSMTYAHFGRCTRRCRKEARVMMKISHLLKTHLVLRIWFHKSMVKLLLSLTPSTGWGLNRSMVAADALIDSQQWDQSMWMDWNAPCVWSSKYTSTMITIDNWLIGQCLECRSCLEQILLLLLTAASGVASSCNLVYCSARDLKKSSQLHLWPSWPLLHYSIVLSHYARRIATADIQNNDFAIVCIACTCMCWLSWSLNC